MNLYNLTNDDLAQLRTIPTGFKACPHWDNRIRFFEMKGKSYVLFCCNRPDLDGNSEPIGEEIQRSQECIINWGDGESSKFLATNYLDNDGNVVAGAEDFGGGA